MTKHEVLALLRGCDGYVSGQLIGEKLHISRMAIWKAVDGLRREGYEIASKPREGYRLLSATSRLSAEEIRRRLGSHPWSDSVVVMEEVDSTNNFAKQLAAAGAPEGTCVLSEVQTAGRGRRGRQFDSPAGMGIYLSIILRPDVLPQQVLHLTAGAAVAIAEAVEAETGLHAYVKWVNDLVAGGKKLCGILTELSAELESGRVEYIVVGAGLNCCQLASDFSPELADTATSVAAQTGKAPDRNALAAAMISAVSALGQGLLTEQAALMERYRTRCVTLGKPVRVLLPGGAKEGRAIDLDESAALQVEYADGTRAWISSGEVSVRGLYGYI